LQPAVYAAVGVFAVQSALALYLFSASVFVFKAVASNPLFLA
jgi:hypothetical protein